MRQSRVTGLVREAPSVDAERDPGLREALEYLSPHERTSDNATISLNAGKVRAALRALASDQARQRAPDGVEEAAKKLWHRFAPSHSIEWEDETHKAEYRSAAEDVLASALERCADERAFDRLHIENMVREWLTPALERPISPMHIDGLVDVLRLRLNRLPAALSPERADGSPRREMEEDEKALLCNEVERLLTEFQDEDISIFRCRDAIVGLTGENKRVDLFCDAEVLLREYALAPDETLDAEALGLKRLLLEALQVGHERAIAYPDASAAPPPDSAPASGEARVTEEMVEAGNDAAYEAAALGGDHKAAMRAALEAALAVQPATLDRGTLDSLIEKARYTLGLDDPSPDDFRRVLGPLIRALPSASTTAQSGWNPTHRHVKRGSEYEIVGRALLQAGEHAADNAPLVVYRGKDGQMWARPTSEFNDGRFETIPEGPRP